jgi:hypothetical protein
VSKITRLEKMLGVDGKMSSLSERISVEDDEMRVESYNPNICKKKTKKLTYLPTGYR